MKCSYLYQGHCITVLLCFYILTSYKIIWIRTIFFFDLLLATSQFDTYYRFYYFSHLYSNRRVDYWSLNLYCSHVWVHNMRMIVEVLRAHVSHTVNVYPGLYEHSTINLVTETMASTSMRRPAVVLDEQVQALLGGSISEEILFLTLMMIVMVMLKLIR